MKWDAQWLKGWEAAMVAVAASASPCDQRLERNQHPATRMVSPKAVALIHRPASSGSMPTQPPAASNRGNKGGHPVSGLPVKSRQPSPARKFRAVETKAVASTVIAVP